MYLGIDQSLRSSGVAVISATGERLYTSTVTPGKLQGVTRLAYIRDELRHVISNYEGIQFAALEGYSMESVNRSFDLGELGGLVRILLHDEGIPFVVVPPTSLKLFVSSNGNASKEMMREAVFKRWGIDLEQNDICDAFGLAHVARSVHLATWTTRSQLEVVKKLTDVEKKVSLTSIKTTGISL